MSAPQQPTPQPPPTSQQPAAQPLPPKKSGGGSTPNVQSHNQGNHHGGHRFPNASGHRPQNHNYGAYPQLVNPLLSGADAGPTGLGAMPRDPGNEQQFTNMQYMNANPGQQFHPPYGNSPSSSPAPNQHHQGVPNVGDMKPTGSMPPHSMADYGNAHFGGPSPMGIYPPRQPRPQFYANGGPRPSLAQQHMAQFVQTAYGQPYVYPQSALLLQNSAAPLTLIPGTGLPYSQGSGQGAAQSRPSFLFFNRVPGQGLYYPQMVGNMQATMQLPQPRQPAPSGQEQMSSQQMGQQGQPGAGGPTGHGGMPGVPGAPGQQAQAPTSMAGVVMSQGGPVGMSMQMPVQMAQSQPGTQMPPQQQAAPPARQSKKIMTIINPVTGSDVLGELARERKQPSGPKTSHAIDIRSPTGETIICAAPIASGPEATAEDEPPVAEPLAEAAADAAPEVKTETDGERRQSTPGNIPSFALGDADDNSRPELGSELGAESSCSPSSAPGAKAVATDVAEAAGVDTASAEAEQPNSKPASMPAPAQVNGEAAASPTDLASPTDGEKAAQRPKEKKGKDKGKWESKGSEGSGDMDAYVDAKGPVLLAGKDASSSSTDAARVQDGDAKDDKTAPAPAQASEVPQTPADGGPAEVNRQTSSPPVDPSLAYLSKLKYKEGQFRPDFPEGKRVYDDVEFLLTLRECPLAMTYPKHLIKSQASAQLSIWKQTPDSKSKMSYGSGPHGGGMMSGGAADIFTPAFIRGPGGGGPGGGGGGMNMRDGRMGVPKRPSQGRGGRPQQQQQQMQSQKVIAVPFEDVKLHTVANAWKPGKKDAEDPVHAELYKKVRGILNKLTPQKFDTLVGQVKELEVSQLHVLMKIIDMVFEKACDEPGFATAYSKMCRELSTNMRVITEDGQEIYFRKALLMKCQREFEAERLYDDSRDEKLAEIESAETEEKKKELMLDLEEKDRKMKRRYLGTIRFIGELFMMSMLTVRIMHECVERLLSGYKKTKDEDRLECLCKLLTTIGAKMDEPQALAGATKSSSTYPDHQEKMASYFNAMQSIVDAKVTSSRVRFMLLDVIDLRRSKWVPRREDANPKTIDQIHKEAEAEEAKRNVQILEAKQREREKNQPNQQRRGDRGTGTRGSQEQQNPDEWTRVQASKRQERQERQNMQERTKYDTNRLAIASTMFNDSMALGPGGGGAVFSQWKTGAAGGRQQEPSSNKFAVLDSDRRQPAPVAPRFAKTQGRGNSMRVLGEVNEFEMSANANSNMGMSLSMTDYPSREGLVDYRDSGVRSSASMGNPRDSSTGRSGEERDRGQGPRHSMMSSRNERDSGPGSFGSHRGAPPGQPFSQPPLLGPRGSMEHDRPGSALSGGSGSRPSSGLGGPAVRPSASLGSNDGAPASGLSSPAFKGPSDVVLDDMLSLCRKLTDKYCSRDCDPTSESAVDDVITEFHATTIHVLVKEGLNHAVDKRDHFRKKFGAFLRHLMQRGLVTPAVFISGLKDFVATAEDIIVDIPKFWDFLGDCLGPIFLDSDGISLGELKKCSDDQFTVGKMLAGVLRAIAAGSGSEAARMVWERSGLAAEDLCVVDQLESFVKREKLEFIDAQRGKSVAAERPAAPAKETPVGGKDEWVSEKSSENFRSELLSLLRSSPPPLNEDIVAFLEGRVEKEYRKEKYYVQAVSYCLFDVAIEATGVGEACVKLDKAKLLARLPIFLRTLDALREAEGSSDGELQILIAATHICQDKKHPPGLATDLFETLDDTEIVAEETFEKWQIHGGTGIRGYAIVHEAVKQFYEWMQTADAEDANASSASQQAETTAGGDAASAQE